MSTADHELHAALQADVADELRDEVARLEAEVLRLKRALQHEVLEHAGFTLTGTDPARPYRRESGLGSLSWFVGITPEDARRRLATYGIAVHFTEETPAP